MQGLDVQQANLDHQSSVIQAVNQQHGLQPQTYYHQYQQHKDQIDTTNTRATINSSQQQFNDPLQQQQQQHNTFQSQAPTTTTSAIQGNFQNVLNLQRQQLADGVAAAAAAQQQQQQQELQKSQQVKPQQALAQQQQQPQPYLAATMTTSHSGNAFVNEFNMQCATNAATTASTATSTSTSSSGKSQVRVCINRLNVEDARLMQQSIKKFVQKSPELARNMGLLQVSATATANKQNNNNNSESSQRFMPLPDPFPPTVGVIAGEPAPEIAANDASSVVQQQSTPSIDMFTAIKADEKRTGTKRKLAISLGDIPPEQICMSIYIVLPFNYMKLNSMYPEIVVTKPKLRRVERITPLSTPKSTKEEVTRSQTYQQFMRNMEQIIEMLDDTESPNFDSGKID